VEVVRLNQVNAAKSCEYFWLSSRYYPDGRGVIESVGVEAE